MEGKIVPLYDSGSQSRVEIASTLHQELDHSQRLDALQVNGALKAATKKPICEVRVSCIPREGVTDGTMEVCFEYSGDPEVVSFLLDQAKLSLESSPISDAD